MFLNKEFSWNNRIHVSAVVDLNSLIDANQDHRLLDTYEDHYLYELGEQPYSSEKTAKLAKAFSRYENEADAVDLERGGLPRWMRAEILLSTMHLSCVRGTLVQLSMSEREYYLKEGKLDEECYGIHDYCQLLHWVFVQDVSEVQQHAEVWVGTVVKEMKEKAK